MTMNKRDLLLPLLLLGLLVRPALAAPATVAVKVTAIEAAQTTELARLNLAVKAVSDPAEILRLQRCAVHVKTVSRLALYQAQLDVTTDEVVRTLLTQLVERLSARLEAEAALLPSGYAFDPLAAITPEVPPCDE